MKFISLIIMILSAVVPVVLGTDMAQTPPNGDPCDKPEHYACGNLASYNKGNAYLSYCLLDHTLVVLQDCTCPTCCSVWGGGTIGRQTRCN
ncbi:uncharacterized protein EDB93DRAFT_1114030 [Suillus bovinus]|uniref:uncharacterized protein n=1 Tax=Suillus bovinus TaxID=48563 RepID=UPI001B85F70D|nr:uncharacterized protein EDB93DRAFT_1114030 [Suillus bovinus]KAG2160212.1 hypothetical protein EDB93DRAFT_1114030 [Suillus bovinus]